MADEPSAQEQVWYPGLAALAGDSPAGLLPTEIIYLRYDGQEAHELHVRRTADPGRPYVAWIERLIVARDGSTAGAHQLDHTIRDGATPYEAANAASIAAGWFTAADLVTGRHVERFARDLAERERARTVAERRHLAPVPPSDPE